MNTDQVVEMIDAITEGREYTLDVPKQGDNDNMSIDFGQEYITFSDDFDFSSQVDNPRTAREIAGALVAWANRKEGKPNAHGGLKLGLSEVTTPSTADAIKLMSGRESKTDWFTRSVHLMSIETLRRNFDDLMKISKMKAISDNERADINKAKDVVWVALKTADPNATQCRKCLLLNGPLHSKFCEGH